MELELGLAVLGVVAITATAVYLVSVMGIKEKSFEEAIAEQKKRSEDLLGRKDAKKKVTVKDKNKKQKKAKEKEKHHAPSSSPEAAEETDSVHHYHHDEKPHHVEIIPEPEIMEDGPVTVYITCVISVDVTVNLFVFLDTFSLLIMFRFIKTNRIAADHRL